MAGGPSTELQSYQNRHLPEQAGIARFIEKWAGIPLNFVEAIGSWIIVRPMNAALRQLDGLSYKLEGTLLKRILQHSLFPVIMIAGFFIGLTATEAGASTESITTLALIPVVIGLIVAPLERLLPYSRNWLEGGNDSSVDLMMFISGAFWNGFAKYLIQVLFLVGMIEMLESYGHGLWPGHLPIVVQVFLFILIKDFFRYWLHRALHEVPFLWRFHAAHHSVKRLYWLNGIRSHPVEVVGQAILFAFPYALLQPSAEIAMIAILMQLTIGIFQHANIDLKLGFWEYIFSIGDNHRYHHYPDKKVGDSNYGGEFILFDILFGTFHKVKGERPHDRIGIGTAPNYPMTMAGLYIAPFLPDQKVFGPEGEPETEDGIPVEAELGELRSQG
ncbi:Sterol desaturase/sphingolipid hydroxylase, fatty acid hydroxylase superfamily [Parasphingorhabdus marina DSM 22363]|uniref:Sterol desaturase/sphingolipid hydroxylase, fatty acid hydroxylase superfamily n=2 Tax=Parasphingorhabdus marina TaxID=394732 RepID=A0A1N6D743_9SPHN|nr:Sterol desaturase/sphingolipid hydroxylase, fatty acid hydroxylase superfamily [Parasphingorhabdus marina DSM 22363]